MKSRIVLALLQHFGPRLMQLAGPQLKQGMPALRNLPIRKLLIIAAVVLGALLLFGMLAAAFVIWLLFTLWDVLATPQTMQAFTDLLGALSAWLGSLTN